MALPTNYYVDPAAGTDDTAAGRGDTSGDPWASLQWALDHITQDTTNGDQINLKAGTDDTLGGSLDVTGTYGTPTSTAPLVLRGYTSAVNDGGQGSISGDGTYGVFTGGTNDYIWLIDLELHNSGAVTIITFRQYCRVENCEIHNTSSDGMNISNWSHIVNCNIYDCDGAGCRISTGTHITDCYFKNGAIQKFSAGIVANAAACVVINNIFSIDSNSIGIISDNACRVASNSVLGAGGTSVGIRFNDSSSFYGVVSNNIVEGVGGLGFDSISTSGIYTLKNNAAYNNGTNYGNLGDQYPLDDDGDDNENLASSPFAKTGADTFANRFVYFAPRNVGNVRGGSYPTGSNLDKGAVQHIPKGRLTSLMSGGNL